MNLDLLNERIKASGITITHLAKRLDISRDALYNKLNGVTDFKVSEANVLFHELKLEKKEKEEIFLT